MVLLQTFPHRISTMQSFKFYLSLKLNYLFKYFICHNKTKYKTIYPVIGKWQPKQIHTMTRRSVAPHHAVINLWLSTILFQDYEFHKGKSEYEDILQANNLPSTATARGHQSPAAFLIMASGLDGVSLIKYLHLELTILGIPDVCFPSGCSHFIKGSVGQENSLARPSCNCLKCKTACPCRRHVAVLVIINCNSFMYSMLTFDRTLGFQDIASMYEVSKVPQLDGAQFLYIKD